MGGEAATTEAMRRASALPLLLIAAAAAWHAVAVAASWASVGEDTGGRDFASYYYAAQAAVRGLDPYDVSVLSRLAAADGTRAEVHPFFYPPPFLLLVAWAPAMSLYQAFRVWFWLDELALVVALGALWAWRRSFGPTHGLALVVAAALATAVPNNHGMGQANLVVLAFTVAGLAVADAGRPGLGGALLGAACTFKMSPFLFVLYAASQRRWRLVGGVFAAAVGLAVASLVVAGPAVQLAFWARVLPGFAQGTYNGLQVDPQLFGNHSVPNVLDWVLPGRSGRLSTATQVLSTGFAVLSIGGLGWAFARPARDALADAARVGAIGVGMLLIPLYTYEHHVVWAIPAVAVCVVAAEQGRLRPAAVVAAGLAIAVWAFELGELRSLWLTATQAVGLTVARGIAELKFVALLVLLGVTVGLGAEEAE